MYICMLFVDTSQNRQQRYALFWSAPSSIYWSQDSVFPEGCMRWSTSKEAKDGANGTEKSTQGKYPHGDLYMNRDILSNQSCSRSPPSKRSISPGWLSVWQLLLELWKRWGLGGVCGESTISATVAANGVAGQGKIRGWPRWMLVNALLSA